VKLLKRQTKRRRTGRKKGFRERERKTLFVGVGSICKKGQKKAALTGEGHGRESSHGKKMNSHN